MAVMLQQAGEALRAMDSVFGLALERRMARSPTPVIVRAERAAKAIQP